MSGQGSSSGNNNNGRGAIPGHRPALPPSAHPAGRPRAGGRARLPISERDAAEIMRRMLLPQDGRGEPDDVGYAAILHGKKGGGGIPEEGAAAGPAPGSGARAAINIDTLVQGTDMPPGMTLRQAARKSVIACVSDFAAKGVRPRFGAVSVSMPRGASRADVAGIARGFADAAGTEGIRIVAGDTNAGTEFAFTVCLVGAVAEAAPAGFRAAGRGGAAPGDLIFVSGPFGYAGLGLESLLQEGGEGAGMSQKKGAEDPVMSRARRSVLRPGSRMEFGARCAECFTSSMDSSDGLAATLNEMARMSGCGFEIHTVPATRQLARYAQRGGLDLQKMVFHGGEEYEIVFTTGPGARGRVMEIASDTKTPVIEIGKVAAPERARGAAGAKRVGKRGAAHGKGGPYVRLLLKGRDAVMIADSGWDHFLA